MRTTVGVLVLALCLAAGCGDDEKSNACKSSLPTLKIGTALPMSGGGTGLTEGPTYEIAMRMAVDDINAAGGVDKHCVELVTRDNQNNPAVTVAVGRELVDTEGVSALVVVTSSDAIYFTFGNYLSATPVANKVPVICLMCSAPTWKLHTNFGAAPGSILDGTSSLWRMLENNTRQGTELGKLAKERGYTTAGTYTIAESAGFGRLWPARS